MTSQLDEAAYIAGVKADGTIATDAYWGWDGSTPAGYATGYTDARKWGPDTAKTGATASYYFDTHAAWSAAETQVFRTALALWSAVANVTFTQTTSSDGPSITFFRGYDGKATAISSAIDSSGSGGKPGGTRLLTMTSATVSIDTAYFPLTGVGGPMTALHEIGHAIGLGHGGPYNETVNSTTQQNGAYDTRAWSVMSYIADASTQWNGAQPESWMPLDILAIQNIYGVAQNTPLSGGQVFGFNSNIGGDLAPVFDFTRNTTPVITLWDKGTGNTLDISGYSQAASVDLTPGAFSSVGGLTHNIAIAYNTAIDTLVCGGGNTTVICNNDGDTVRGGAGNDTFTAGTGNDVFDGGGGSNTVVFNGPQSAYTVVTNADGSKTVSGYGASDRLTNIQTLRFLGNASAAPPANDFNGDGQCDLLWQNDNGSAAIWTLNGTAVTGGGMAGSTAGSGWRVVATHDFNGDGKADILWQNANGTAAIWNMSGTGVIGGGAVGPNPGSAWRLVGTADFNGDGQSDLLWQNANGAASIWTMNGSSVVSGAYAGPNPGASWHLVATADINGDGKADLVWQADSGQVAVWTMNGAAVTGSAAIGRPDPSWHVKATGDFDGDGKTDILLQNDNGQATTWFMNGLSVASSGLTGPNPGANWTIAGACDFNHDGKTDILWQRADGQAAVWIMNGLSVNSSAAIGNAPGASWHLATG